MPFVLIIIGLVLIYLGVKNNKNNYDNKNSFENILSAEVGSAEINSIKAQIEDIDLRIGKLEEDLLILNKTNKTIEKGSSGSYDNIKFDEANCNNEDGKPHSNVYKADVNLDTNKKIYNLIDEGKSIDEISSIMQIGKGEILLRLGLRKSKDQS